MNDYNSSLDSSLDNRTYTFPQVTRVCTVLWYIILNIEDIFIHVIQGSRLVLG